MLTKKILGAKVLDTNGYVQATRLITPTNTESDKAEIRQLFNEGSSKPSHQLGDIYSANMIDVIARAVSQGDAQLDSQVNAEAASRKEADDKLSNRIDETNDKLNSEIERAKSAEQLTEEKLTGMTLNGSYDKDKNILTINLVIPATSKSEEQTISAIIDLGEIIDSNDLTDSDSTTVERANGKSKTNVNSITEEEVNNLIKNA